MRRKRGRGMTALWIGLTILFSVWSVLLFAEVDSDMTREIEAQQIEKCGGVK